MKFMRSSLILILVSGCSVGIDAPAGTPIVALPGGTFVMGNSVIDPCGSFNLADDRVVMRVAIDDVGEQIIHSVTLDGFCMDQHEVTNEQYAHCVAHGACGSQALMSLGQRDEPGFVESYGDNLDRYGRYPAVGMSWQDAQTYCNFRGGQLPTEVQWEYAARSRGARTGIWVEDLEFNARIDDGCAESEFAGSIALGGCAESVLPVGTARLDATADAVYDLAGNVAEYTADAYDALAYCDRNRPALDGSNTWQDALFETSPDGLFLRRAGQSLLDVDQALCGHELVCAVDEQGQCVDTPDGSTGFGGRCLEGFDACIDGCRSGRMPEPFLSCGVTTELRPMEDNLDPGVCLRACTQVASQCMDCCTQSEAVVVCAPTGTATSRCAPVPWCFPRQGGSYDEAEFAGDAPDASPVIRGGDFMLPRACDARPTRRRTFDAPRGHVGFRCVYNTSHGPCSLTP